MTNREISDTERVDLAAPGHEILAGEVDSDCTSDHRNHGVTLRGRTELVPRPAQHESRHSNTSRSSLDVVGLVRFLRVRTLRHARAGTELARPVKPLAEPRLVGPTRAEARHRVDLAFDLPADGDRVERTRRRRLEHGERRHVVGVTIAVQERHTGRDQIAHEHGLSSLARRDHRLHVVTPAGKRGAFRTAESVRQADAPSVEDDEPTELGQTLHPSRRHRIVEERVHRHRPAFDEHDVVGAVPRLHDHSIRDVCSV